jgi:hypothetical protein
MIIMQGKEINAEERFYSVEDESTLRNNYLNCIISKGTDKSKLEQHIQFYDSTKLHNKNKEHIYMFTGS